MRRLHAAALRLTPTMRGMLWIGLAGALFIVLNTSLRELSLVLPEFEAAFLRYFCGLLVLMPRTRALGGLLAALNMVASMFTNYEVDGFDYFLQVLVFDVSSLALALLVLWHYRDDLRDTFRSVP